MRWWGLVPAVAALLLAFTMIEVHCTPLSYGQPAFATGLALRGSREIREAVSAPRRSARRCEASAHGAAKMGFQSEGGDGMGRREAILLALSAGTILLGRQGADAAALAPAEDPESPFKGFILPNAPGRDRNKISVMANKEQKEVLFPPDATTLKAEYKKTDSGLFFKIVKEGEGDIVPQPGDTLEINYIGSVCEVDKDGSYDCAPRQGLAEIYPTMPQGIIRDSPKFDSSFDRGRPMRVFFKKAQLSLGLEEAVADMKPGGVKMVFLIPELSLACPQTRVCVADIEPDERMAFYLELVSINPKDTVPSGATPPGQRPPLAKRKRLFGSGPLMPTSPEPAALPAVN